MISGQYQLVLVLFSVLSLSVSGSEKFPRVKYVYIWAPLYLVLLYNGKVKVWKYCI